MPIARPVLRRLFAASLAVAALLVVASGPASALEPPRPLPGYRPAFVTETDEHPWTDCLWASAAMLLDKWTNGDVTRTHQQLRALSGDRKGGSTFNDMAVAFRKLGFRTPSNLAGSRLTWHELLKRLANGGGAVVLGDYGDLPRWYGRWDYGFWKSGPVRKHGKVVREPVVGRKDKGKKGQPKMRPDNHAVYVERYDRKHGRVWMMDPLARGDWKGEWISVGSLMRFAWSSGGRVYAVATPTAAPAPFTGVRLGESEVDLSDAALTATWNLQAPRGWRWPGADVHVAISAAAAPLEAAARSALVDPGVATDAAPAAPVAAVRGDQLRVAAALPTAAGAYTAAVSLTDPRFGRPVAASSPVAVFVPGDERATIRLNVLDGVLTAGRDVRINLSVANAGDTSWADTVATDGGASGAATRTARQRETRVTAHWIRLGAAGATSGAVATSAVADADPRDAGVVTLMRAPLDPGALARFRDTLVVPSAPGEWALVVDVEDSVVGSFAALGNAPAVAIFQVVPPRGIESIE